jgi:hypothetical protein
MLLLFGNSASGRDRADKGEWIRMRVAKLVMVTLTMTASLILGAAATADAGPVHSKTGWCC